MAVVDVFISYSRADKDKVAILARMIANEGYDVWWDADLPPHVSYGDVITAKIGEAKAAVVVWSETAAKSEWVRAEADVARNQKKLIQTSIGEVIPPLPFNQIQCAEIGDWDGAPDHRGWSKVKQSLSALCGEKTSAAAKAAPQDTAEKEAPTQPPKTAPTAPQQQAPLPPPPAAKSKAPEKPEQETKAAPATGTSTPVLVILGCGGTIVIAFLLLLFSAISSAVEDSSGSSFADLEQFDSGAGGTVPVYATVQDSDGYTNVRAGPSTSYDVIGTVSPGEEFLTFEQPDAWWIVTLENGTMGYIYSDRIRMTRNAQ